jgi:hypothetical protein
MPFVRGFSRARRQPHSDVNGSLTATAKLRKAPLPFPETKDTARTLHKEPAQIVHRSWLILKWSWLPFHLSRGLGQGLNSRRQSGRTSKQVWVFPELLSDL